MGVARLQTFLERDVPNEYCWEVNIRDLADKYRSDTGREPVVVVHGKICVYNIYRRMCKEREENCHEWLLGDRAEELIGYVREFVNAFKKIGIKVVFYFAGVDKKKLHNNGWRERQREEIEEVMTILNDLKSSPYTILNFKRFLPPLVSFTVNFAIKYRCGCDVVISRTNCVEEIADYARQENCFAVLSQDTSFVILQGASHYLSLKHLDLANMTTLIYSREGLERALDLERHQLLLLASLLGNKKIPVSKLSAFHDDISPETKHVLKLLPCIVEYIKTKNVSESYEEDVMREIARDVFGDEDMAKDLMKSIETYLPGPRDVDVHNMDDDEAQYDENWRLILELGRKRMHCLVMLSTVYEAIKSEKYRLGVSLVSFNRNIVPMAELYQPLRQRIYGMLLFEKPETLTVKELCVDENRIPDEPLEVPIKRSSRISSLHKGLLYLWSKDCLPDDRWRLFADCLTQHKKLSWEKLKKLDFRYVVPVSVLFYLWNDCFQQLQAMSLELRLRNEEQMIDVILAHVVAVGSQTIADMIRVRRDRNFQKVIELSTIFYQGVKTVLFLLSACGFELEQAMPWLYCDGVLLYEKYVLSRSTSRIMQLCDNKEQLYRRFSVMKELIKPRDMWR